jgi:Ca-activated chloride channel homolog
MRSWARLIVVSTLILASEINAPAQSPTFRSATELVNLNVTVVGANARAVTDLTPDRFEVFEDGVRQKLQFFAPGDLPVDVLLLVDTSGSMAASLPLVQQAAQRFVHALRPVDRASVMGVSNHLCVLQGLTGDIAALDRAIASTKAGGRTLLYASIYTALSELAKIRAASASEARRQAMVVLSDGVDTSSTFSFDELMANIHRHHAVPIYTIAPRPAKAMKAQRESVFGENTATQDFELRKLATETGGRAFFPVALHELSGVYADIATELAHQYALGYQSSNRLLDGTFRRIAVRVAASGVKWRTRAGYVAEHATADNNNDQR